MWICGKIRAEIQRQFFPQVHIYNNSDNGKFTIEIFGILEMKFIFSIEKENLMNKILTVCKFLFFN